MKKVENIKILSMKEEAELSPEELITYYNSLKEYLLKRKYTNLTPGALHIGPKLKKLTNKLATKVTKMFSSKNVKIISDGQENIPDGPVIFAHTHQGILDGFVWIPEIDRHCFILHGSDVNKLLLMCQYNTGLILTKKSMSSRDTDEKKKMVKKYNLNAKMDMIELLINGHSISYFPEGTWNLSPNKLHLPINIGFLDIAKKAGVPVIPVVHEFTYKSDSDKEKIEKVHSRFGKPICIDFNDNIFEKLKEYEEQISTMRWELIEEKGIYERKYISTEEYSRFLNGNYRNLKLGKLDIEMEQDNIFGAKDDFYKFHHINAVPVNEKGELEPTNEVKKLIKINEEHGIARPL